MGRPRADDRAEPTRARILAAAAVVFAERGAEKATLAEIALAAGIRRPSLLYHFTSKELLYETVVRDTFAALGEALGQAMAGAPDASFAARLESLTRTFVRFLADHRPLARIVVREMVESDGPGVPIVREQVAPLLATVVAFVEHAGKGLIDPSVPVRAAVLQIVADGLMQNAAEGVRDVMWGEPDPDRTWRLARALLMERPCDSR